MNGSLFIIAAPSGAGKTSLVKKLLAQDSAIRLSISYTTRAPRPGEADGRDYHFVTEETFQRMQEHDDFLESALVHGNHYGTSRNWIDREMAAGVDILLEIDWQGARQVCKLYPEAVSIFILPPSLDALERRLHSRGQDDDAVIERRLSAARDEMSHLKEFNYAIINNEFDEALCDLAAIVRAERLRCNRQLRRPEILTLTHLEN